MAPSPYAGLAVRNREFVALDAAIAELAAEAVPPDLRGVRKTA